MENKEKYKKQSLIKISLGVLSNVVSIVVMSVLLVSISTSLLGREKNFQIMGYSTFYIETFSMDSVYPVGSIIVVKRNDGNTYEVGDDISFYDVLKNGDVVTHRVVDIEIDSQGKFYVTKGVDNENVDSESVFSGNVIGKVVYSVPKIGIYIDYIKSNPILVIGFGAGVYVLIKSLKEIVQEKKEMI